MALLISCDVSIRQAKLLFFLSYGQLTYEDAWVRPTQIPV